MRYTEVLLSINGPPLLRENVVFSFMTFLPDSRWTWQSDLETWKTGWLTSRTTNGSRRQSGLLSIRRRWVLSFPRRRSFPLSTHAQLLFALVQVPLTSFHPTDAQFPLLPFPSMWCTATWPFFPTYAQIPDPSSQHMRSYLALPTNICVDTCPFLPTYA